MYGGIQLAVSYFNASFPGSFSRNLKQAI